MSVRECDHSYPVLDTTTSTEICRMCGLVLQEQVFEVPPCNGREDASLLSSDLGKEMMLREELLDILSVISKDSNFMVEEILSFVRQHVPYPHNISNYNFRGNLAFCIWEVLNRHGAAFSPKEIAYLCNVSPSMFTRAEKVLHIQPTYCPPSMYAPRLVLSLGLSREFAACITSMVVRYMEQEMTVPEAIIGGLILQFGETNRMMKKKLFKYDMSPVRIGITFGITPGTILRAQNKLPKKILDEITFLCLNKTFDKDFKIGSLAQLAEDDEEHFANQMNNVKLTSFEPQKECVDTVDH